VLLYAHATQAGLWFGSHRIIARGRLAFWAYGKLGGRRYGLRLASTIRSNWSVWIDPGVALLTEALLHRPLARAADYSCCSASCQMARRRA
jgi:hypothetical protein